MRKLRRSKNCSYAVAGKILRTDTWRVLRRSHAMLCITLKRHGQMKQTWAKSGSNSFTVLVSREFQFLSFLSELEKDSAHLFFNWCSDCFLKY